MEFAFSIGSNLGDRLVNLQDARRRILAVEDTRLVAQSPVYETEPVGVRAEYRNLKFLNAVLIVESGLSAEEWLLQTAAIEDAMGRRRGPDKNAPRPIDIDMLYVDDLLVISDELTLPHPRWAGREFVVRPLADLKPDLVLPGCSETVAETLKRITSMGGVALREQIW